MRLTGSSEEQEPGEKEKMTARATAAHETQDKQLKTTNPKNKNQNGRPDAVRRAQPRRRL